MEKKIQEYNSIFWEMISGYDASDSNILRKIIHSFTVANTCFTIACRLKLNKPKREFAYLVGLFHDIGRFYQWEHYKTYNDRVSVDHGDVGANIMQEINAETLGISQNDKMVLIESIKYHTKPYRGNDNSVKLFNTIVNNADAFSNVMSVANGAFQISINKDGYNDEILNAFMSMELLLGYKPESKLDIALMSMANTYYVKYDFLRKEIVDNGYIDIMFDNLALLLNEQDYETFKNAVSNLRNNYFLDESIIITK